MRRLPTAGVLLLSAVLVPALAVSRLHGQAAQTDQKVLASEVASVKQNKSGDRGVRIGGQQGRFNAVNVTMFMLIRQAYRVEPYQIVGGPGWLRSDRFDIVAKGDASTPGQMQLMTRSLLSDRFKLLVHTETRQDAIYDLVLARRDESLGPQLRPSTLDCATLNAIGQSEGAASASTPVNQRPKCGIRVQSGIVTGAGVAIAQLVAGLAPWLDRIVADKTGLTGSYDIDLHWTPEQTSLRSTDVQDSQRADANGPSIFTALQEQLGLKLDPRKGPVDVLVIDHAERPTPD